MLRSPPFSRLAHHFLGSPTGLPVNTFLSNQRFGIVGGSDVTYMISGAAPGVWEEF